jgi:hypothetical protein
MQEQRHEIGHADYPHVAVLRRLWRRICPNAQDRGDPALPNFSFAHTALLTA